MHFHVLAKVFINVWYTENIWELLEKSASTKAAH